VCLLWIMVTLFCTWDFFIIIICTVCYAGITIDVCMLLTCGSPCLIVIFPAASFEYVTMVRKHRSQCRRYLPKRILYFFSQWYGHKPANEWSQSWWPASQSSAEVVARPLIPSPNGPVFNKWMFIKIWTS